MNILFIVPYVPNLIRVRPYNLIRHLSEHGHSVTVLTIWTNEREREDMEELKKYCKSVQAVHLPKWRSLLNCLTALPTHKPLQSVYCWDQSLVKQIASIARSNNGSKPFDVIHVEHLRGALYGLYCKALLCHLPVVWDSVDCISLLFQQASMLSKKRISRLITSFELERTQKYEWKLAKSFNRTLVTSPADRDALLSMAPPTETVPDISVLPNGVDLSYFKPDRTVRRECATLVISGKMSYHANISMVLYLVQSIMPIIWSRRPDVQLWIVGKDPSNEIQALANQPGVMVTGTVNDIRPYLQKATIAVAPLTYGAGIQNKVLESLACATPLISTPQAVSAIGVEPGREVLVASEPGEFAGLVLYLLENPQCRQRLGEAGRKYVEQNHPWTRITDQLEGEYDEVIHTEQ